MAFSGVMRRRLTPEPNERTGELEMSCCRNTVRNDTWSATEQHKATEAKPSYVRQVFTEVLELGKLII